MSEKIYANVSHTKGIVLHLMHLEFPRKRIFRNFAALYLTNIELLQHTAQKTQFKNLRYFYLISFKFDHVHVNDKKSRLTILPIWYCAIVSSIVLYCPFLDNTSMMARALGS